METELEKAFTWEIENFSERNYEMKSDSFSCGGCEWYLGIYPKGYCGFDDLYVYFGVSNPESLKPGWKSIASYFFIMLNQSGKELYRTSEASNLFCSEDSGLGYPRTLPLNKLQEQGFLENNKLTIEVYIKVKSVTWIFEKHPDFVVDFRPKKKLVKMKEFMNTLHSLIETLRKSPKSLTESELSKAGTELSKLMEAGFKLEWLKSKLENVSVEWKKAVSDGSQVEQLEERIKYMELDLLDLKAELDKEKVKSAKISSFDFIDFIIKRFFLSCFTISKH